MRIKPPKIAEKPLNVYHDMPAKPAMTSKVKLPHTARVPQGTGKPNFSDAMHSALKAASPAMHARLNASPIGKMPPPNSRAGRNIASYNKSFHASKDYHG